MCFQKKTFNTLFLHTKFNHKIELLKNVGELDHSALEEMSVSQLKFVKRFLEKHPKKSFIEASSASCSNPILLAKKPSRRISFCVDY